MKKQIIAGVTSFLAAGAMLFAGEKVDLNQFRFDGKQALTEAEVPLVIGLEDESSMEAVRTYSDFAGNVTRYQQTFRGVPVWGEQIIVANGKQGARLHGNAYVDIAANFMDNVPSFDEDVALDMAKRSHLGKRANSFTYQNEKSELNVYIDEDGFGRYIYAVSFFADDAQGNPTRPYALIDAESGEILKAWEGLTHSSVGTGPGGNQKVGQYEYGSGGQPNLDVSVSGSTYTMNNTNVKTVNLNGATSGTTAYSYSGPRNTFQTINGAYSPLNDAHHFGGVVFDMFNAWVGSPPLTFQLTMRVHYSTNYENAFWNGSEMTFGDGASTFYPLVSLDVSAHEVAHGFTEQNSALVYSSMSGGMNEAFSDMAGEAAENYDRGSNDWYVGYDIYKSANGALRYMNNPPQDNKSIDHQNDFYAGLDVHYSSGVYNKAFYLLATTSGWTVEKAFKTMARANQLYWTANSTFNEGACGVETAATDLGYSAADVSAAFQAVGVECGGTEPNICLPNGNSCSSNADCCSGTCSGFWIFKSCR